MPTPKLECGLLGFDSSLWSHELVNRAGRYVGELPVQTGDTVPTRLASLSCSVVISIEKDHTDTPQAHPQTSEDQIRARPDFP